MQGLPGNKKVEQIKKKRKKGRLLLAITPHSRGRYAAPPVMAS